MKTENTEKVTLHEQLQEVLDSLGNTPIVEKEIFEALDAKPLKKSKAVKLALSKKGLKIKDFTGIEIAAFFNDLSTKILATKNKDGVFKSTPLTENFNLPDFEQAEDVSDLLMKLHRNHQEQKAMTEKISNGEKLEAKVIKTLVKDYSKILTDLQDLAWEISGLKKDDLIEWEQTLITEQIFASVKDVESTSMGKPPKI